MRMLTAVLLVVLIAGPVMARELTDREVLEVLAQEQPSDRAVRKALAHLRSQQKESGALGDKFQTAITSLAIMAHLAAGVMPDDPEHGAWLRRGLEFVLGQQSDKGYFGSRDNSRMYGHGITTLMLAEVLGAVRDEALEDRVREALERGILVTIAAAKVKKSSEHAGGWRYNPGSSDSDLSLSGWQLLSLHAAQQVGVDIPEEVIKNAVEYARRNVGPDGKVGYQGRNEHSLALRGLGMLCFAIGGNEDDPLVDRICERIRKEPVQWADKQFFYRVYYDAVGMSRARPAAWETYGAHLTALLVEHQQEDGSWGPPPGNNEGEYGSAYMTSMAVLALAVNRHVLPAYQR